MAKAALVTVLPTNNDLVITDFLSDEMIKVGEALVRKLDSLNFIVDAALWFYLPEEKVWRLLIASPEVKVSGPKKAYKQIQNAIGRISDASKKIRLRDISVLDSKAPLIGLLKIAIKTEKSICAIRFTRIVINDTAIEDAYIYRLV